MAVLSGVLVPRLVPGETPMTSDQWDQIAKVVKAAAIPVGLAVILVLGLASGSLWVVAAWVCGYTTATAYALARF